MAVRQYVGARYVPKFYQNSTDPSSTQWEENRSYEALEVVSYNNDSYTSKIPVPAGIGNPASNPTYWARTGAYNAQVEQYRQEVVTAVSDVDEKLNQTTTKLEGDMQTLQTNVDNTVQNVQNDLATEASERKTTDEQINNTINDLKNTINKRIVFVGDSYGELNPNFIDIAIPASDITYGINISSGSHGFIGDTRVTGDNSFLNLLKTNFSKIESPETITDVYVFGGVNDAYTPNYDGLITAIGNFKNYCSTNLPNAKITVFLTSWTSNSSWLSSLRTVSSAYSQGCIANNMSYVIGLSNAFHETDLLRDQVHPTESAMTRLGNYLASYIKTGSLDFVNIADANLVLSDNWGKYTMLTDDENYRKFRQVLSNGRVKLEGCIVAKANTPTTTTWMSNNWKQIATINGNSFMIGNGGSEYEPQISICWITATNSNTLCIPVEIIMQSKLILIRAFRSNEQLAQIDTQKVVLPIKLDFPAYYN